MKGYQNLRQSYLEDLRLHTNSPQTISTYGYHIQDFLTYLTAQKIQDIRQVKPATVHAYRLHLDKRYPKGLWSITVKVRAVRSLFAYLSRTEQVLVDPSSDLKAPRLTNKLPRSVLTAKQARKILDQPDLSKPKGILGRAILETLYATGIRAGEMEAVDLQDVNLKDGLLTIQNGKGGKARVCPLTPHAVKFIQAYLRHVRPAYAAKANPTSALWLNVEGGRMKHYIIRRLVTRYGRKAGIKGKKLSPHAWRHGFATELVKGGADIRQVQELLGHSEARTSAIYTQLSAVDVKKAHAKAYPAKPDEDPFQPITKIKAGTR